MTEKTKEKTIYNLRLHETLNSPIKYGIRFDITKVSGGWIYQPINRVADGKDEYLSPCFVPYDNEFLTGSCD